jgi:hypothetical protein
MKPERIQVGTTVRVGEHYRIADRRGMVGRIADHYGEDGYMVVDVRLSDRLRWLFWPEDLEEISPPRPWWHSLVQLTKGGIHKDHRTMRSSRGVLSYKGRTSIKEDNTSGYEEGVH